jgi:transposase
MKVISTRQAAKKLGLHPATLANYIAVGKLPSPNTLEISGVTVYAWTDADIENARKLLPKIANGRKTRYSKLREKQKAQTKSPVPRKAKKKK